MLLENKKLVLMGVRNKWSIAWGAAKSAHDNGAQLICTYHLEINFSKLENLLLVKDLLEKYQIVPKILNRNGSISLYIKEGEDISKLLVYIGASNAMLKFEEIRVIKEARNNVNRMVNCEVANLNKTVNAASRQIEAIRKIKNSRKFTNLPEEYGIGQ